MSFPSANSSMYINSLHPSIRQVVRYAMEYVNKNLLLGYSKAYVTSGYRSAKEQENIYAKGRRVVTDNKGNKKFQIIGKTYTNARAWDSYHNYGLAFDVGLFVRNEKSGGTRYEESADVYMDKDFDDDMVPDYKELVHYLKYDLGFKWGGDWVKKDIPHFETDISIKHLREAYKAGQTFTDNNRVYVSLNYLKGKGYAVNMPIGADISVEPLVAKL